MKVYAAKYPYRSPFPILCNGANVVDAAGRIKIRRKPSTCLPVL